jgi:hypothetical protein
MLEELVANIFFLQIFFFFKLFLPKNRNTSGFYLAWHSVQPSMALWLA